nr:PAS domain S-box protein [Phyllobacterium sp. 21LDTY02-6]
MPSSASMDTFDMANVSLKQVLDALPEAVYTVDQDGRITYFNDAAAVFWGVRPELRKSEFCGSWRLYWPDGRPMPHDECPMALALRQQVPNRGHEAIAERPDGSRVPFQAFPTPILNHSGKLLGAINMLVDLTDSIAINQAAQRYQAIIQSSDDAIVSKDLNGIITSWNPAAEQMFGYKAEEAIGQPILLIIPADHHSEETEIIGRIRRGERTENFETIRRRKDGSLVEVSLTTSPVRDRRGIIVGASKIARDITDRRRAEQQQHMLIREMDHRIKNLFALANSIVSLSSRFAETPGELAISVGRRMNALSRAHSLTTPSSSTASGRKEQLTTLHDLIWTIISPYVDPREEPALRCKVTGADITVNGPAVTSMALLLHEFATNAAKYGALSVPEGRIDIDCMIEGDEFVLQWVEAGGPPVVPTEKTGFGTLLEKATVSTQLDGRVTRSWDPEGIVIKLTANKERLSAADSE